MNEAWSNPCRSREAAAPTAPAAIVFGVVVALHYAASYDRVRWLLQ